MTSGRNPGGNGETFDEQLQDNDARALDILTRLNTALEALDDLIATESAADVAANALFGLQNAPVLPAADVAAANALFGLQNAPVLPAAVVPAADVAAANALFGLQNAPAPPGLFGLQNAPTGRMPLRDITNQLPVLNDEDEEEYDFV
jgi:hypothetical protein